MSQERENPRKVPRLLWILAGTVAAVLVLAALYVVFQAMRIIAPPNTYETTLLATVSDTISAQGVLFFEETQVPGSGSLGYLVEDGERVSAGTAVAEIYSDASQSVLRQQLTEINSQIELLQKSQNTGAAQLEMLIRERSAALYDLMDSLDQGAYEQTEEGREAYLLAQNKLWVTTGEVTDFSAQIAALQAQASSLQAQLGVPAQITAPVTGYFIRSGNTRRLIASAEDILALDAAGFKAFLDGGADMALEDCAGKIVSGFTWYYCGVCTAKEGEKLLGADEKPLTKSVEIRFPGQAEEGLKATLTEVTIDAAGGLARFILECESINGDVLRLGQASAQIVVGSTTGLRVRASAVHYIKEDGSAAPDAEMPAQGENYIPGIYVKYGNLARFCRIDPVDDEHPLVTDGDYILVMPSGTAGSISQVRLYDEVIVSGQNLYDGKLLR